MNNFKESEIEFSVNDIAYSFKIYNDLPNIQGQRIEDAVTNWVHRTREYTPEGFVEYIKSKNVGVICLTEKEYLELSKNN